MVKSVYAHTMAHLGLGNRVRSVLGARELARAEGRDFCYSWPVDGRFGARMDELWEFDDRLVSPFEARWLSARHPALDHTLSWLDDEKRSEKVWRIRTAHALPLEAWHSALRTLRPTAPIADRISTFFDAQLAGTPYIGVMIRAHAVSHEQTRLHSPLNWYYQRMLAIREALPDVPFFISCDVDAVAQSLARLVGGCHFQADKGAYNSKEALLASICDLYLLAGSAHLIGPYFSSFPEMAQILAGNLPFETSVNPVTNVAASSLVLDPTRPSQRRKVLGETTDVVRTAVFQNG